MKLQSFELQGRPAWGIRRDDRIYVMTSCWPDVAAALAAGPDAIQQAADTSHPSIGVEGLTFLPPVVAPRKIFCVGLNYGRHVLEAGRALPQHPSVFLRHIDSFVGHDQPVWRPKASTQFDYEAELAVVIGRGGRNISEEHAASHVGGYTCMAENSVRDFQKHNAQVTPGKNFDRSGAIGPWLVTADDIPDPSQLRVVSRLNGTVMQDGGIADLIFSIPVLIAYLSRFTTLSAGDIIATGTPEGVGSSRKPPVFMQAGDVLDIDIAGVGCLVNTVIDEPDFQSTSITGRR